MDSYSKIAYFVLIHQVSLEIILCHFAYFKYSDVVIGSIDELSIRISQLDRKLQSYTHLVPESRAASASVTKERRPYEEIGK
jgi:hypothetical protein